MLKTLLSFLVWGSAKAILLSNSKTVMFIFTPILRVIMKTLLDRNQQENISTEKSEISNAESYQESDEDYEEMKIVNFEEVRKQNIFLLECAKQVFPCVDGVIPVQDLPSMFISRDGRLIAYGWIDESGCPEFMMAVPRSELS